MTDPQEPKSAYVDSEQTEAVNYGKGPSEFHRALDRRSRRPTLSCLSGNQRGMRHRLDSRETVLGRSRDVELRIDDMQASRRHILITYENLDQPDDPPVCFVQDLNSRNGTELNGTPLTGRTRLNDSDRITIGQTVLGFFLHDEAELRQHESLYRRATRDPLTGLYNRQQIDTQLRRQIEDSLKRGSDFCFLILDIDKFKAINDTHGHAVGDQALRHVAQVLERNRRLSDFLARWGGEEFAIALPGVAVSAALIQAERLRASIEQSPLVEGDLSLPMTVSIGLSPLLAGDTPDSLFQRADECLYRAKETGRNRVVAFEVTVAGPVLPDAPPESAEQQTEPS